MQDAVTQVSNVIEAYFDMLYRADCAQVTHIFHPEAHVQSCAEDVLTSIDMEGFKARMRSRPVPQMLGEKKDGQLVSLVFPTESMAQVTLRSTMLSLLFVDTLILLKVAGEWKIISKVFCSYPA